MLYGLLLVGGKSSRMGEDKANLCYTENHPEWQRLLDVMSPHCDEAFLCHREGQEFAHPSIIDSGNGPLAAIAEAMTTHPNASWLVVACDMPLLDSETIGYLIESRDTTVDVTCYKSPVDTLPDPLCAIYESSFSETVKQAVKNDHYCPRSLLGKSNLHLLSLKNKHALMNANTPAEKLEVKSILNDSRTEKKIQLRYFAQLKEIAEKESENMLTESVTPAGLYEELKSRYQFPHKQKQLMVAINEDFASWETILQDGDEVVFIPPVAGG